MASILFKVVRVCDFQFKCSYLRNKKVFLYFLFLFWILHQILNFLKENVIVIANAFPKLQTVKIFVRKLSQEHCLRTGFGSQYVKASQLLGKSPCEPFYHVLWPLLGTLIWNMPSLVLGEIFGMFVNTLTSDRKYPVQGCENLQLPIHMQLSEKKKTFSQFYFPFLESTSNFKILKKNMIVIANVFPKLQTVKNLVRPLSKKRPFRTCFDSEHVKASQLLAKSWWEPFYHFLFSFSRKLIWNVSPLALGEVLGRFVNTFECRWQLSCSWLWEFAIPSWNPIIWKTKTFFWSFFSISGFYIKFWTFWKKRWSP